MNPLLLDVPEEFTTERLLIRVPRRGDGAPINQAVRESLDELRPWMHWAQVCPTPEESEIVVRECFAAYLSRSHFPLRLFCRQTGRFIGASGLHRVDWNVPSGEIGYWLRAGEHGKGFATEAVIAITRFGFDLSLKRIEIRCDPTNGPSARVAERAGYQLEATLRCNTLTPQGKLRDTRVYSRIAPP